MGLFSRIQKRNHEPPERALASSATTEPRIADAPEQGPEIRVSRTLVKSEPELAELVGGEPRVREGAIVVTLAEKGFGTRVVISARADSGLGEDDLRRLLEQLAEPQKRPFSNA